jgi:AcrR family transcriptional regulator
MPEEAPAAALSERLVQVTLDLLAADGLPALTLRRIAREAGVSHGAPLRHFRSFADLKSEVAAHGFRLLSEAIDKSVASLSPQADAAERLARAGRAYVDCAVGSPELFALMFRSGELDPENAAYARDSRAAFDQLLRHVREVQETGWLPDRDTGVLAGSIWAAVHGLATLWSEGAYGGAIPHASLEDAIDALGITLPAPHSQGGKT